VTAPASTWEVQTKVGTPQWNEAREAMATYERAAKRSSPTWLTGAIALGGSGVLLALTIFLGSVTLSRLHENFGWVLQTQTVLREVARAKEALLESSSATRSFVISGDADYLKTYRGARREIYRALPNIVGLVRDNPGQYRRAVLAWFDRAGGLTAARRTEIGMQMRSSDQGPGFKNFLPAMRAILDTLRANELELLTERQHQEEADQTQLLWLCGIAAVLSMVCGLFGALLVQRERGEHRSREIQLELMHAQRMGLVNQSSSMLAHELNQPLTAAANYLAALKRYADRAEPKTPDNITDLAQRARLQVVRASGIVVRLHRFIDKHEAVRAPEALTTLIDDAVSLLGTLDETIALQISVEPGLPPVAIDRVQVQQVLVNLMRNALEAMHGRARSELRLSVISAGPSAVLFSLADNGPGLSKQVADRLFQPFVTSKKAGLGIGLSICRTIILDHGGKMWAESSAETGTVFHFTLPTVPQALAA
jgi:two-component system sensor kinase FixL